MIFLDQYTILATLKADVFSVSYLALNQKANKTWEIRVIPKSVQVGHRLYRQSLSLDLHQLTKLSHPNLQRVIDVIEDESSYTIVLDTIQGCSLNSICADTGPQPVDIVIPWAVQLCDVLEYLHTKAPQGHYGFINSSHIFIQPDGRIVLTDHFIRTECVSNNHAPCYLTSPFYFRPDPCCADERTHIYYLGATMLSILNGIAFCSTLFQLVHATQVNPALSEGVKETFLKCIDLVPANRYQTFSDLSYALSGYNSLHYRRHKPGTLYAFIKQFKRSAKKKSFASIKDVQFSAIAPTRFVKGKYSTIDIFMYEDAYKNIVAASKMDGLFSETTTGYLRAEEGTIVSVHLRSPDIAIEDDIQALTWYGKYLRFRFIVYLPEDFDKEQICFDSTIYFNAVIACSLKFVAPIVTKNKHAILTERTDYSSAFISYASQDRQRIIPIIQGMKKMRPDLDIFFDIDSLKSGERWETVIKREIIKRDIMFLCWSRSAKESTWVEMEWRYALQNKGIDAIEPIPLESPLHCPPPRELETKHFNDRELYYIAGNP